MEKIQFKYVLTYRYFERYTDRNDKSNNRHEDEQEDIAFIECDIPMTHLIENVLQSTYGSIYEEDDDQHYLLKKKEYTVHAYVEPIFKENKFIYPITYTLDINDHRVKINCPKDVLSDLLIALENNDHKAYLITKVKEA